MAGDVSSMETVVKGGGNQVLVGNNWGREG